MVNVDMIGFIYMVINFVDWFYIKMGYDLLSVENILFIVLIFFVIG